MNIKVCPKAKVTALLWLQFQNGSGQLSGYDMPRNVDPSVEKGVGFSGVAEPGPTGHRPGHQLHKLIIFISHLYITATKGGG